MTKEMNASAENKSSCPINVRQSSSGSKSNWMQSVRSWLPGYTQASQTNDSESHEGISGGCPGVETYNHQVGDFKFGQERDPRQSIPLRTDRQHSTILKGENTPTHQPDGKEVWVYPSEQQYYNAMKRKGWDAKEEDVPVVLAIHNAVNEQGWHKVKEWEALRGSVPKLKEFRGRPLDISPKAWILTNMLGYKPPFDRHDWIVESGGRETRYVLDFYAGKGTKEKPVGLYLDVRPALDSIDACIHRVSMFAKETFGVNFFKRPSLKTIEHETHNPDDRPPSSVMPR